MRVIVGLVAGLLATQAATEPRFRVHQIDGGQSEAAAVADLNNDGRLDIISSESWYEAPSWTKHSIRSIPFTSNYVDNFGDLPIEVDGDGNIDLVQIAYFARKLVWLKNPGKSGVAWSVNDIESIGPTEFAFLVDLDNDGQANDLLPQFTGATTGLRWYELEKGQWLKHEVATESFGHGIGAGDVNGDKRADILTPRGWLEAPADPRAPGLWTFHETSWSQLTIPVGAVVEAAVAPTPAPAPGRAGRAAPPRPTEFGFMHVLDVNNDGRNDIVTTMAHSFGVLWIEQTSSGTWTQHLIDNSWSRAHASFMADINGDKQLDFITGTRFMGRNAQESEPLALYWYEFTRAAGSPVRWVRHTISAGGQTGTGLQLVVADIGKDGDLDVVGGGKSGLFLSENVGTGPGTGTAVPQPSTRP